MINALGAAQKVTNPTTPSNQMANLEKDIAGADSTQPVLNTQNIPTAAGPKPNLRVDKPGTVNVNPDLKNFKKGKKKVNLKIVLGILALVLLLVGGGVGLYLTRVSQEIRQQAAVGDYCNGEGDCRDSGTDTTNYTCDTNDPNHPPEFSGVCKIDTNNCSSLRSCGSCSDGATAVGCVYYPSTGGCGPECHILCSDSSWSLTVDNGPTCDSPNCAGAVHINPCDNWEKCPDITPPPTSPPGGGPDSTPTPTLPFRSVTPPNWLTPGITRAPSPTPTLPGRFPSFPPDIIPWITPTATPTGIPTPTGTLSPTPTGTLSPTPTGVVLTNTPVPPTNTPPPGSTSTPVPQTTTVVYNYTPAPTSPGCNSYCTDNATCTSVNSNWICYENKCRLDVNPTSPYCDYPQVLPQTGPTEWLNFLKVGLGMLGSAALLLLLL